MNQNDRQLENLISERLEREMTSGIDVKIDVHKGNVTLSGVVDTLAEKMSAGEIIRQVSGVKWVDNSLAIGTDNWVPDDKIEELILDRLARHPHEQGRELGVSVHKGIATLMGHAESVGVVEKAMELAREVRGVKEVFSKVHVAEADVFDDASITNAVEDAFAKSPEVKVENVETSTRYGEITLRGVVSGAAERKAAARIAAGVPGVRKVHNILTLEPGSGTGDTALTNRLREALKQDPRTRDSRIMAYVVEDIAFLAGSVMSPDIRHAAEEVARQLTEIHGVSNDIEVMQH